MHVDPGSWILYTRRGSRHLETPYGRCHGLDRPPHHISCSAQSSIYITLGCSLLVIVYRDSQKFCVNVTFSSIVSKSHKHPPKRLPLIFPILEQSIMVGVPGKYKGCNTCRARRVKVRSDPVAVAFCKLIDAPSSVIMNVLSVASVLTQEENVRDMVGVPQFMYLGCHSMSSLASIRP